MVENGRYVPDARTRWLLLGTALVLAWVSARAAVQSTFAVSDPEAAAAIAPASGRTLAAMAQARVTSASGEIDDQTRALFRSALAREPLLAEPLTLAALDAANAGDSAKAERLMLAARERDLRSPLVRFWLLDHFVRTGKYAQALEEVGPAIRLQPDAITAIMTVLSAMADTDRGNKALAAKLATHPFWETSFFQTAASNTAPDALLALLSQLPNANRAVAEQRAVFLALIDAGKGVRAYQTWRNFLPAAYRSKASVIYDGNFASWPGATPFNWTLTSDEIGTTRMVRAGDLPQSSALDVRYFGSTSGVLASQYVVVAPGAYKLQVSARSRSASVTGGRLNLELRCLKREALATLPLNPLSSQLRPFAASVVVPAGCDLMLVQLIGIPGELFSEVEAQVTGMSLTPLTGTR
jgi:tetratricopeptide (TPR) repeat protein